MGVKARGVPTPCFSPRPCLPPPGEGVEGPGRRGQNRELNDPGSYTGRLQLVHLSPARRTHHVGFQGYCTDRITGDSGSGRASKYFQGESVGVGPGLLWLPAFAQGKRSVVGKWLHDLASTNRLNVDYGQITIGDKF